MRALKGHGTENDFVIIPDLDGALDLSDAVVRAICDRHAGIGADGVLRVVRSIKHPDAVAQAGEAEYFMDYRNADGSTAEMCGNGVRVFLRYLQEAGLAGDKASVATRGGVVETWLSSDGDITVRMAAPVLLPARPEVTAAQGKPREALVALTIPNPHVVVRLESPQDLADLDLSTAPKVEPGLPDGQNVEFFVEAGDRHIVMRVSERGVGETRSCGTGICAAAVAAAHDAGVGADGRRWRVDVPGGTCWVAWTSSGAVELTGPAVLVAELDIDERALCDR